MVDKSNEYGFVPSSPTQARGSNTGVFEVNDIVDLLNAEQWSGQFGALELIETKTASGLTTPNYVDFESIQESTYSVHLLTYVMTTSNSNPIYIQFRESGTWETASVYDYANYYGGSSFSDGERSSGSSYIQLTTSKSGTAEANHGYVYFYNLGDSNVFSSATYFNSKSDFFRYGGGVMHQTSTVDGIRFGKTGSTSYDITAISLYGLRESV